MQTKDKMFIYFEDLDMWVSLILVLATETISKMSYIDSQGNIRIKPFRSVGYGGCVILPTRFSVAKTKKSKQVFEGIEAFAEKLKRLFPEMKITTKQLERDLKKAVNEGKFTESSVSNMVKVYCFPSSYLEGRLRPNKKDHLIFKAKPKINFPAYPEHQIPLG